VIYLLDTDTLIYLIKQRPPAVAERVDALSADDRLGMSFVSFAELLKGAERSVRKIEMRRRLDTLVRQVPVFFETGPALCAHWAAQFVWLKESGTMIGVNDLWIACHALSLDAVLVTNNTREFGRIEGLRLENWAV
jgi:tRNA(fMet)-specific endonuclease VapC